jgi:hypothetical protein
MSLNKHLILFNGIFLARHPWLTLVILATWEAEIRRIMAQGQPWQIFLETSSPK